MTRQARKDHTKLLELVGKTYGDWKVVGVSESKVEDQNLYYDLVCTTCGEPRRYDAYKLARRTKLNRCWICSVPDLLHFTRKAYYGARNRCSNPKNTCYNRYGGRGIRFQWKSFSTFLSDMGTKPSVEHTLERIDNDKDYCKDNCCWATRKEQAANRCNSLPSDMVGQAASTGIYASTLRRQLRPKPPSILEYQGRKVALSDLAKEKDINAATLRQRLSYGWSLEDALNKPVSKSPWK